MVSLEAPEWNAQHAVLIRNGPCVFLHYICLRFFAGCKSRYRIWMSDRYRAVFLAHYNVNRLHLMLPSALL